MERHCAINFFKLDQTLKFLPDKVKETSLRNNPATRRSVSACFWCRCAANRTL